ncbi:MAG: hypothetical protein AVDCRST_MAG53-384, partial [uncultured Solirubrobacteraceae bacterium]
CVSPDPASTPPLLSAARTRSPSRLPRRRVHLPPSPSPSPRSSPRSPRSAACAPRAAPTTVRPTRAAVARCSPRHRRRRSRARCAESTRPG